MKVIGLTGPKTVGKTTIANAISDNVDKLVYILSFATPLRAMLSSIGVEDLNLYSPQFKEEKIEGLGKSARELLQTLGTDWGRKMVHPNIWLWAMSNSLEQARLDSVDLIVIDDCRFNNEADWIREIGGSVILLEREGHEYGVDAHATEKPIAKSKIDLVCDASDIYKCSEKIIEYGS